MRANSLIVTVATTLGLAILGLPAMTAGKATAGDVSGVRNDAATELGTAVASDQITSRRRHHKRMTTGAGSKVGTPNNGRPTGTQAPDAQMGGGGKSGAR